MLPVAQHDLSRSFLIVVAQGNFSLAFKARYKGRVVVVKVPKETPGDAKGKSGDTAAETKSEPGWDPPCFAFV